MRTFFKFVSILLSSSAIYYVCRLDVSIPATIGRGLSCGYQMVGEVPTAVEEITGI